MPSIVRVPPPANIAAIMMPTENCRQMLKDIMKTTGWSRMELAAVLGVSPVTLHTWFGYRPQNLMKGHRTAATRRLIWLIDAMVNHPDRLYSWKSIASWGREGLPPKSRKSARPTADQPPQTSSIAEGGMSGGCHGVPSGEGDTPVRDSGVEYRFYGEHVTGFVVVRESGEVGGWGEGI